jgi:hypothetical protein
MNIIKQQAEEEKVSCWKLDVGSYFGLYMTSSLQHQTSSLIA